MNNGMKHFMIFVLGAAVGSLVTQHCVKSFYQKAAQEEIDSVKEVLLRQKRENESTVSEPNSNAAARDRSDIRKGTEKELSEYAEKLTRAGYRQRYKDNSEKKEAEQMEERPYVISPEEFGENEEYERISLTYYSNNVLTDENDDVIEDVDETVGVDSLTHFGEYEEDSVFVRNDARRCDYEILLDQRSYSEVLSKMPHRMEVR